MQLQCNVSITRSNQATKNWLIGNVLVNKSQQEKGRGEECYWVKSWSCWARVRGLIPFRRTLSRKCNPLASIWDLTHSTSSALGEIRSTTLLGGVEMGGQGEQEERDEIRKKRKMAAAAPERTRTGTVTTTPPPPFCGGGAIYIIQALFSLSLLL